ncbi:hypothetical protein GGR54DRAFT_569258 [Hypoxylon sp. NC1633]|nr:hypothetical protein GGR54DRAFT_569258 [Hypoxylon sp. NC1633]
MTGHTDDAGGRSSLHGYDKAVAAIPEPSSTSSQVSELKREHIGQFDPHHEDPNDTGVTSTNHALTFTDINYFIEHINTFLADPDTAAANERQILLLFQTLIKGPAFMWWINELSAINRRQLQAAGLPAILQALQDRFKIDPQVKYLDRALTLQDIIADKNSLSGYIHRNLRYARAMGIMGENDSEWHWVMEEITACMPTEVQEHLPSPLDSGSLDAYMRRIELKTPALRILTRISQDAKVANTRLDEDVGSQSQSRRLYDSYRPVYDAYRPVYDAYRPVYDAYRPIYDSYRPTYDRDQRSIRGEDYSPDRRHDQRIDRPLKRINEEIDYHDENLSGFYSF